MEATRSSTLEGSTFGISLGVGEQSRRPCAQLLLCLYQLQDIMRLFKAPGPQKRGIPKVAAVVATSGDDAVVLRSPSMLLRFCDTSPAKHHMEAPAFARFSCWYC